MAAGYGGHSSGDGGQQTALNHHFNAFFLFGQKVFTTTKSFVSTIEFVFVRELSKQTTPEIDGYNFC